MIVLKQNENGLLGDENAIKELATKDSARILALSDSHRNPLVFEEILLRYGEKCDAVFFAGDGIYDMVMTLEHAMKDEELKNCIPQVFAFVQGNGDPNLAPCRFNPAGEDVVSTTDNQLVINPRQILKVAGQNVFLIHGHLQSVDFGDELLIAQAKAEDAKIIIHGHTHFPRQEEEEDCIIINPGSTTRPRGGSNPGFAIITIDKQTLDVSFIDVLQWHVSKKLGFICSLN